MLLGDFDTRAASESGKWVHIKNPKTGQKAYAPGEDGKPDRDKPFRIHILGPDSATLRERVNRRVARIAKERAGRADISKMSEAEIVGLLEQAPDDQAEECAMATTAWENMPTTDGDDVAFTEDAARILYQSYPDILRQVADERKNTADFFDGA